MSSIDNFLEHRKAVENLVGYRYHIIYYACLICCVVTVIAAGRKPGSTFFISACIALVCLIADILIALKFNIPLNNLINIYGGIDGTVPQEPQENQEVSRVDEILTNTLVVRE